VENTTCEAGSRIFVGNDYGDRYGQMLGSDDRIYACTLELGVPVTKNLGFHQVIKTSTLFV